MSESHDKTPRPVSSRQAVGVMKLGSALFGLVASVLLARPALEEAPPPSLEEVTGGLGSPVERRLITYAPSEPPPVEPEGDTSEQGAPLRGFALVLESEPAGALVLVNGKDKGETPSSLAPECKPGEPLRIEFSLRGYERALHETTCKEDTLLKVLARLRRAPRGGGRGGGK